MSIILDALKRADKKPGDPQTKIDKKEDEQKLAGSTGVFAPQKTSPKIRNFLPSSLNLPLMIFSLILVIVLCVGGWFLFFRRGEDVKATAPKGEIPVAVKQQKQEIDPREKIDEIKKRAQKTFYNSDYLESIRAYKELVGLTPADPEVYNNYGVALKKAGKLGEAREAYETAVALDPQYTQALNNLAVIELAERNFNEAKHYLETALQIDPSYMDANLHMAVCYERLGEVENAIKYYEIFLQLSEGKYNRKVRIQIESRLARLQEDIE